MRAWCGALAVGAAHADVQRLVDRADVVGERDAVLGGTDVDDLRYRAPC